MRDLNYQSKNCAIAVLMAATASMPIGGGSRIWLPLPLPLGYHQPPHARSGYTVRMNILEKKTQHDFCVRASAYEPGVPKRTRTVT